MRGAKDATEADLSRSTQTGARPTPVGLVPIARALSICAALPKGDAA